MKLNDKFILRQVADNWVVLSLSDASVSLDGMIRLNESAVLLWRELEKGANKTALVAALTKEYDVDAKQADEDVEVFLKKLVEAGCLSMDTSCE